jgi:hypothetical protein
LLFLLVVGGGCPHCIVSSSDWSFDKDDSTLISFSHSNTPHTTSCFPNYNDRCHQGRWEATAIIPLSIMIVVLEIVQPPSLLLGVVPRLPPTTQQEQPSGLTL